MQPTPQELLKAKKKVLTFHPDKSPHISPDYFRFYKQAYDIVERCCNQSKSRTTQTTYSDLSQTDPSIQVRLKEISPTQNNKLFNEAFEKIIKKGNEPNKNAWFSEEEAPPSLQTIKTTASNIHEKFERLKENSQAMIVHKEVQPLSFGSGSSSFYCEEEEDEHEGYIDSDPFSKLKFDDLRKVYRDQIVLPSSEKDFLNKEQYSSVEQYVRTRDSRLAPPMSSEEAERLLMMQENAAIQRHVHKRYNLEKQLLSNEEKKNEFMSYLLRLK
jgi:hypothetical protein